MRLPLAHSFNGINFIDILHGYQNYFAHFKTFRIFKLLSGFCNLNEPLKIPRGYFVFFLLFCFTALGTYFAGFLHIFKS